MQNRDQGMGVGVGGGWQIFATAHGLALSNSYFKGLSLCEIGFD
jgi:hypothetical protein